MLKQLLRMTSYAGFAALLQLATISTVHADHGNSTNHNHHKTHKAAVGIHGMAVFTDGKQFYASHMPLANSIHAHQVIFSFSLNKQEGQALSSMLAENALVSLMPERFDLMKLMSGELTTFKATLFEGHFERGGKSALKDIKINVAKMMLKTDLITNSNENGKYFLLNTGDNQGLLVHRIVANPSFDQIIQVSMTTGKNSNHSAQPVVAITQGEPVSIAKPTTILVDGHTLIMKQPLYLETQDFQ